MKTVHEMTKKEILDLPDAEGGAEAKWWRSLLIIPLRTKHDSGYSNMAIVGVDEDGQGEVLVRYCDDLQFPLAPSGFQDEADLRMDCYYPSGVQKLWSRRFEFRLEWPGSSSRIEVRKRPEKHAHVVAG